MHYSNDNVVEKMFKRIEPINRSKISNYLFRRKDNKVTSVVCIAYTYIITFK